MPKYKKIKDTKMDKMNPGGYIFVLPPKIAQRKPSITPTIGFKEYNKRHLSGIVSLLNPTGEMYKPN